MKITIMKSKTDQYRQRNEVVIARTGNKHVQLVMMMQAYVRLARIDLHSESLLKSNPYYRIKQGDQLRKSGKIQYARTRELVQSQCIKWQRVLCLYFIFSCARSYQCSNSAFVLSNFHQPCHLNAQSGMPAHTAAVVHCSSCMLSNCELHNEHCPIKCRQQSLLS